MNQLTISYPPELLRVLGQDSDEFEASARLLLALKLYETGKLTSGLAAKVAGIPRSQFLIELGRNGLSPFGETGDELEDDLHYARKASHLK